MFNFRARYLNNLFNIIQKVSIAILAIPNIILFFLNIFQIVKVIPDYLYIDVNNPFMRLLTNTLFFGSIGISLSFIFLFFGLFFKVKCLKIYSKECLEIINETSLPNKSPKVLYVYTTHNDLIESRVLQNRQQTYKNFEVWVSDGSSSNEWREKIKKFCSENNINLFQLGPEGSKNKSDNLNQFLKQHKGDYDYLLIGDADEVFHPNFVEYAMKIFCSNKIKNLSYITPLNINYRSKGIYPNTTRILESHILYWEMISRTFTQSNIPHLAGQSCLISRKSLVECNKVEKFDEGNLEDWYLESIMVENLNCGIILPCTPCYFEPDVNVRAHFSRIMRVSDWIIRWWKVRRKEIIKNYNEKYSSWYRMYFIHLIRPLLIFFSLSLIILFSWILSNYWDFAFKDNILFWVFVGLLGTLSLLTLTIKAFLVVKMNFNLMDNLLFPFVFLMWSFVGNIEVFIHWFKSLFLGRYSSFGGSGTSRFLRTKNKIIKWWLWFIFLSIVIVTFNSLIFVLMDWWNVKWLIIIFNVYVGVAWLGCISYLILWYINFIPYNSSFKREDWIECKNVFEW